MRECKTYSRQLCTARSGGTKHVKKFNKNKIEKKTHTHTRNVYQTAKIDCIIFGRARVRCTTSVFFSSSVFGPSDFYSDQTFVVYSSSTFLQVSETFRHFHVVRTYLRRGCTFRSFVSILNLWTMFYTPIFYLFSVLFFIFFPLVQTAAIAT